MTLYNGVSLLLGLPKTLYFNMKYFKFLDAIKLPVLLSNRVKIIALKGKIKILPPIKTGLIRFGVKGAGTCCWHKSILELRGDIIFEGSAVFGDGFSISTSPTSVLTIGSKFRTVGDTAFYCRKKISIGSDCNFSWGNLIMDSDVHQIKSVDGDILNGDKEISIGDHVWMGCRCLILKGVSIPSNTIVGANSCIHRSFEKSNTVIGGNPAYVLKENVIWED